MAGRLTIEHIKGLIRHSEGFDQVLKKLKIISADKGNCIAELKVEAEHTNPIGGLHGGLSATLIDSLSSFALLTHEKGSVPSVSVDIHISYLKGAKEGDDIVIDARTIKTGKTLAFLEVLIKNKNTGDILVNGSHTKFFLHLKN